MMRRAASRLALELEVDQAYCKCEAADKRPPNMQKGILVAYELQQYWDHNIITIATMDTKYLH